MFAAVEAGMDKTVDVTIPVDPETAALRADVEIDAQLATYNADRQQR
jgi:hypothetical protein